MIRVITALWVFALAGTTILGCGSPQGQGPAAQKSSNATYICHMGADCGQADVASGQPVPSCCGKVMVKADTFLCSCGKILICDAGKFGPECCGKAMKKAAP